MASGGKKRGGSDSAREQGQTGIVIHVSPEQRRRIGAAAAFAGAKSVKAFCASVVLEAAEKILKKHTPGID